VTSEAIKKHGLMVDIAAEANNIPGLVAAIEKHWK
jgi:uroporphyrinogen-III synthase